LLVLTFTDPLEPQNNSLTSVAEMSTVLERWYRKGPALFGLSPLSSHPSAPMFLHIDANNGLAVYDQIVRQIKFSVADGVLAVGERVPSVREMARELTINPNTVARAYRQLQDDQVLEAVRGTGLVVSSGARKICLAARKRLIRARLHDVLLEAHHGGLDAEQIKAIFQMELDDLKKFKPKKR